MKCQFEIMNPSEDDIKNLADNLQCSPIIARILINRRVDTPEKAKRFLWGTVKDLYPPDGLDQMRQAVDIILSHIEKGGKILIHGDYDADGVTSTAILIKALERIGAKTGYYIPDRFDEGYGFSPDAIKLALEENYSLIVTVDCGSSNHLEVEEAIKKGIQVIVTDHHEVPENIPRANAFINAKKPGDTYPFKDLSGAGIAIKLISAVYQRLGREDWTDFLDLAAIGIVADVVPLIDENRIIVKEGLQLLSRRNRPGIVSLLEQVNSKREKLSPWDISFIIAPRINAAGRLADAALSLQFLLEEDQEKAADLAAQLIKMNEERQQVEAAIKKEIEEMINNNPQLLTKPVWVFGSKGWHQGVIGIVASRFCDSFKRPVFLISIDEDGIGRGSSRCGENFNVYEALDSSGDLLLHYGGHKLAGGFSLEEKNIDLLRERINSLDLFTEYSKSLKIDADLTNVSIDLELAKELEMLAPFGEGNSKPHFISRRVKFQSVSTVGNNSQHLKLWVSPGKHSKDLKGISFGSGKLAGSIFGSEFYYDIIYNLDVDEWNNQEELALKITEIIQPEPECLYIQTGMEEYAVQEEQEQESWRIIDARPVIDRRKYIKHLAQGSSKTLVLTRNLKQMKVLMHNLEGEGVHCRMLTAAAGDLEEKCIYVSPMNRINTDLCFTDIVYYHPPFDLEDFQKKVFSCPCLKRVHMLFGDDDVEREEMIQEMISPEREKLLKIFSVIKSIVNNGKNLPFSPEDIVKKIEDKHIKPSTIAVALKIFQELRLLDYTEQNNLFSVKLYNGGNVNLEESPTYVSHIKHKRKFLQFKQLFLDTGLDNFRENIQSWQKADCLK